MGVCRGALDVCVWEGGWWGLRLHEARIACVYVTQIYQFTYWLTDKHRRGSELKQMYFLTEIIDFCFQITMCQQFHFFIVHS